jgi:glucokinase
MILGGDIGGTHTRLAIFDDDGRRAVDPPVHTYPSREHAGLGEIVRRFLDDTGARVAAACFGVAGPVKDGRSVRRTCRGSSTRPTSAARSAHAMVINDLRPPPGDWALSASELAELLPGAPGAPGRRGSPPERWSSARPDCTGTGGSISRSRPRAGTATSA